MPAHEHHTSPNPAAAAPEGPARRPTKFQRRESLHSILSTISILILAPVIAVFLINFIFQSYLVDGPSMEKTLYNNDRLIVWKLPRTWARITGNDYIPKRGDIVVFTEPDLSRFDENPGKQIIKRVIGLPGDRVVIENGTVTLYNDDFPNGFQPDVETPHDLGSNYSPGNVDVKVKEGQVFVLGDNRVNSLDSPDFGPVDADNIVGKLILRIWPVNETTRF